MTAGIKDCKENLKYLKRFNFDKNLPKLIKKLKGKSIIIYGAGAFFELIKSNYNLDELNIIGISDKRFEENKNQKILWGYKVYSPSEISSVNPDYVIVSTKQNIKIIEYLYNEFFQSTNIKIIPLVNKNLWKIIKDYFIETTRWI